MYRQGDIGIFPVNEIPANTVPVDRDKHGRIVLAEGEVTGHFHCVLDDPATLFRQADMDEMADRFLRVEAETGNLIDAYKCRNPLGGVCWLPAYQSREQIEAAGFSVLEREDVEGVVVTHDEHLHQVVTPGDYLVRRQREFAPEAPVYVAD